jgi:hypothetical protein
MHKNFAAEGVQVLDRWRVAMESFIRCLILDGLMRLTVFDVDVGGDCFCLQPIVFGRKVQ